MPPIVKLTKMGDLDMSKPASAAMALLKKLKPSAKTSANSGEKQMSMLRRLPKILRWIPGKAQDMRAWFLSMQYWLGGSDDNIEQMIRFLIGRYSTRKDWRGAACKAPVDYPEVGLYHPRLARPHHHRSGRPAAPRRRHGHRRPADAALLRAGLRHRALRCRDRRVRGEGHRLHPRLCRRP